MPAKETRRSPDDIDMIVGQQIRTARVAAGMSQEALGDALGITFQQIQKYEKGHNRIAAGRLQMAADILGKPISYFFGDAAGSDKRKSPDDPVRLLGTSRDGHALAVAFNAIGSPEARRSLLSIAQNLAT